MKNYLFIDYATQAYIAVVGCMIALFHNHTVAHWQILLLAHGLGLALVHGLVIGHHRWPGNRVLDFLRHYYPILLYSFFYRETGELNRMFFPEYLDHGFIRLEDWLFGFQPCIEFMDRFPYLALSEIFYASYFSYYVMITGVGLALLLRNRRQFAHYVTVVSFVFYLCYLTYICLPVMGPRAFFREIDGFNLAPEVQALAENPVYPAAVQVGPFFQIMAWIYRNFEGPGAAFPSSHVAIALTTVWFSFLYLPRIRWLHLVVGLLLCGSTVYCRYHYVVDVVAGAAVTLILVPIGNGLFRRFGDRPDPPGTVQKV